LALQPGARLGPYEIQSAIGAGGMGEVYKARDVRLNRTVAIKVLPPQLADDPMFRERFDREARAISQLDHPHICALHDVGDQDGTSFLVMQFLEGETLGNRLAKGPPPIAQVLTYAIEIADALDNAHRHGVVHRDLKPGNIILTKEGTKLLDFGLAKVGQPLLPSVSRPPLTAMATGPADVSPLTIQGTILGTLQYMAPEQLEGKDADARTDIFAFGAIVFEMATGRPAFEGKSQVGLITAIVDHDPPPISSIQPLSSTLLDHLVKTCLSKSPDARWQTMADVLIQLKLIATLGGQPSAAATGGARLSRRLVWGAIGALLMVSAALGALLVIGRSAPTLSKMSFEVTTGQGGSQFQFALSPDGKHLVAIASSDKGLVMWHRALENVTGQIVPGSEGAQFPFWSPDNRFIGFFAGDKLKKVDVFGAPPQTLSDAPVGRGGTWNADGVIVLAPFDNGPLFRVSANGGTSVQLTELDRSRQHVAHRHPHFLPDGRHFLYTVLSNKPEYSGIYVGSLDAKESRQQIVNTMVKAVFAPPEHLLFVRESTLMAQRLDLKRFELRGDPFTVAEGIGANITNSAAGVAVSDNGVLAYRTGNLMDRVLVWFDRAGKQTQAFDARSSYQTPALSPDARRVAVAKQEGSTADIWILDLGRGTSSRFTFDAATDSEPVWSPDGARIVFQSNRTGTFDLYQKNAGGGGQEEMLLKSDRPKNPHDWSADGRFLLYTELAPQTGLDLWALPMNGDRKPQVVLNSPFREMQGHFSPDSQWIAYVSNESGGDQVYVQRFPPSGGKWQVSTAGGYQPRWRRDGKELLFLSVARDVMAAPVSVSPDGTFNAGVPQKLFTANPAVLSAERNTWDVTPDGQRFLVNSVEAQGVRPITIVVNWALPHR
jgi:eukaryotic-like serine/threonine-protein kinase